MNKAETDQNERNSCEYLRKVGDRYVFDSTSGIYKHKPAEAYNESDNAIGQSKQRPWWIEVKRDRVALCISFFTLILLFLTVQYAHNQWLEAKRSADAAACALKEAQEQTRIQRQQVEGNLAANIIVDSPRPTPFPTNEGSLRAQGLYIYFANAGKVPATNIKAWAEMARLSLPRFEILGKRMIAQGTHDRLAPEDLVHPTQGFVTEEFHIRFGTESLSSTDVVNITKEDEAIRVRGSINYDNGFNHTIEHPFCFMFARIPSFDDMGRDANGTIGTWGLCEDTIGYIKRSYPKKHQR